MNKLFQSPISELSIRRSVRSGIIIIRFDLCLADEVEAILASFTAIFYQFPVSNGLMIKSDELTKHHI